METWKDIPGFGNYYQASSIGRIKVKERTIEKKCYFNSKIVSQKYKERLYLVFPKLKETFDKIFIEAVS